MILEEQRREYLWDELAQPPVNQAERATSYHHNTRIESPPNPTLEIHPQIIATQLGLTPTEFAEINEECIREQRELQEEMDWEDRMARERRIAQDAHDVHDMTNDVDTPVVFLEHHNEFDKGVFRTAREADDIEPHACGLGIQGDTGGDWAEEVEHDVGYALKAEYIQYNYSPGPSPAPFPHDSVLCASSMNSVRSMSLTIFCCFFRKKFFARSMAS